jgi:hypothetical protein
MYGMFLITEGVRQLRGGLDGGGGDGVGGNGRRQVPGAEIAVAHGSGMFLSCMSTAVLGTEGTL